MSNLVRYYLMTRPIHPTANFAVLGQVGGSTVVASHTTKGATLWYPAVNTLATEDGGIGALSNYKPMLDPVAGQVHGEPWLIDSMHTSLDSVLEKLNLVGGIIGMANVRVVRQVDVESYIRLV